MKTDTFDPIHAAEIVEDAAMYLTDQHVLPCDESNACAESLSILGMRLRDMARQSAVNVNVQVLKAMLDLLAIAEQGDPADEDERTTLEAARAAARAAKAEACELPPCPESNADGELVCPNCKHTEFVYVEDIQNWRQVLSAMGGCLNIDGLYHTGEGYDDGENGRLCCKNCCTEYALPEQLELVFE